MPLCGTIRKIKSGMMFERGDLLLAPFPVSDLSAVKRQPVLAITAADSYGTLSRFLSCRDRKPSAACQSRQLERCPGGQYINRHIDTAR